MSDILPPETDSSVGPHIVPHSREAEEAVVGSILINPEAYYDVAQFLRSDDFYIHRHRWIWEAFTRLHEKRAPIDFLTVSEELDNMEQLSEIGGPAYLTALINNVPSSLHAEAYGRIVEETAIRRRMLSAANDIAKLAYQQDVSVNTALDGAEKSVFSISERRLTRDLQPIQQVLSDYYDRIDQLASRDLETYGVPSGFIDLDRLLGGMQPSDFLIIAGRPAMGKTGFLLSSGKNAAQLYKKHVAIFSLEMSNEQLVQRLIAQETGIDSQRLRTGQLAEDEWPLFTHAIEVLSDSHIFLDDTPAITPLQLRTKCRRLHMEYRLDLILVDYLQLMTGETRTENRVQEVSYISRNLKVLARELNVPVLAAAQLSRAVEQRADKRPMLSDLRESGCLAGDSLVQLANGLQVPIRDLAKRNDATEVMALNEKTQRIEPALIRKAWHTGQKPIFKLITKQKKEICATANHKFRTTGGWMRLDQLAPGDLIAIPRAKVDTNPNGIEMNNKVGAEYLQAPGPRDIFWDRVMSISGKGVEDVFDLEVEEHHNFTANDIIVHNSLEQDSDVVMFIYRPDQYEQDTLKQNIAEIIVAKHRNGPVGSVELVFRRNLAKFENAATRHVDLSKV